MIEIPASFARPSPLDAEEELVSRELARRELIHFTTYTYQEFVPEPFHVHLANILMHVVSGDIRRLIVIAPPQHGKSRLTSVQLPAFWFSKHPGLPVLISSYGAGLAGEKAGDSRLVINGPLYYNLFPELFKKARRGPGMVLKHPNSRIYPSGVASAITGRGGGLGIIDDPVKDWEQAYSKTYRNKTWNWWKGTFRPRIWHSGRIVLILTRWHEDDLAGRILNESGDQWTVVRYPALAETLEERVENDRKFHPNAQFPFEGADPIGREQGEALSPIRFPAQTLMELKHDVGPRAWEAEYQGTPRPVEGNLVTMEYVHLVDDWPRDEVDLYVRYWDKGGIEGAGARTSGALIARTKQKTFYLINIVKGQWSPFKREQVIKTTAELDAARYGRVRTYFEHEGGSEGLFGAAFTMKNLAGYSIKPDRPSSSKETRFIPVADQMEAGNFYFLKADWTWECIDELLMFPNGTFKDQADSISGAFKKAALGGWSRGGG